MMSANDSTGETRNWSVFSGLKFGFLLGLVFASGYFAARVSSPSKSSAPTESKVLSDSERLELAQAKYEAIQRKLKLRYHEELTSTPKDMAEQKPTNTNENERVKSPQLVHEKPSSDRMAKALVKVLGTSTPDSVNKAVIKELPTQTGSPYAVQVASLMDRKAAEEIKQTGYQRLRGKAASSAVT